MTETPYSIRGVPVHDQYYIRESRPPPVAYLDAEGHIVVAVCFSKLQSLLIKDAEGATLTYFIHIFVIADVNKNISSLHCIMVLYT